MNTENLKLKTENFSLSALQFRIIIDLWTYGVPISQMSFPPITYWMDPLFGLFTWSSIPGLNRNMNPTLI